MSGHDPASPRHVFLWLLAPTVWFAHFSILYAAAGFGEALGWSPTDLRLFAWGMTAAAGAAIGALLWWQRPRMLAMLSLIAVLLQGLVLAIVPA
jgi:hypothetical protein